ncbi:hypothetical protein NQZ68_020096 [Dissostichus eleginoides]|nr:hypothetical protein NQZ68_020096 [Dissostichus eleginoides]
MKRDNKNLTDQLGNLTQAYTVSESNVKNLSAGVEELKTRNQELETKTNNLTQQIQDMTTNWNELNISRAQWSIDSYCKQPDKTNCQPCQRGWFHTEPSCYVINDPPWRTWEEAREDCKGKNSDLAVAHNPAEKNVIINKYSPSISGPNGYWVGLRVEDGKWKWVDGTDSTFNGEAFEGRCAISVLRENSWVSVSCGEIQRWICQKKALSLSV